MIDIIPSPKKNIVLDATVLSTLMGCHRLTDIRFNHHLVPLTGKSNSLEVGSIVHKFLEIYYGSIIKGFNKNLAQQNGMAAAEMYIRGCSTCTDFIPSETESKPKCGHPINEYPGVHNTPPDNEKRGEGFRVGWKWALETCEQYIDRWKNDHWVPLEVEVVKGEVLYEDDEIRILWKAKIDWIADTNQSILSIDHKTSKQRRDVLSLNNQFIGQCMIMKTRQVIINKIGFQITLKPEEKFTRDPMNYSADRLIEWQSEILPYHAYQLIQNHESGYWAPNFDHCETKYGKCIFTKVCESDRNMREQELKTNFKVGPQWNPANIESDE